MCFRRAVIGTSVFGALPFGFFASLPFGFRSFKIIRNKPEQADDVIAQRNAIHMHGRRQIFLRKFFPGRDDLALIRPNKY